MQDRLLTSAAEGSAKGRPGCALQPPLTFDRGCGSMLKMSTPAWDGRPGRRRQAPGKGEELAMRIGEDQQEFEILPEEDQPMVVPEPEPPRQPEDTPA
jgi:hypothetical protein